jgi:hypothetical protein
MCDLEKLHQTEKSIGIIRPREISDVIIEEDERDWKPKWKALFEQFELFGPNRKPLDKIPYKFKYVFKCQDPDCKGHRKSILDWEVGQLYRNLMSKYANEEEATAKVRDKLLYDICDPSNDIHFFVGTTRRRGAWIIVGLFYPKKL